MNHYKYRYFMLENPDDALQNKPLGRVTKEEREIVLSSIQEVLEEDKLKRKREKQEKRKSQIKKDGHSVAKRNRKKKKTDSAVSSKKPSTSGRRTAKVRKSK